MQAKLARPQGLVQVLSPSSPSIAKILAETFIPLIERAAQGRELKWVRLHLDEYGTAIYIVVILTRTAIYIVVILKESAEEILSSYMYHVLQEMSSQ